MCSGFNNDKHLAQCICMKKGWKIANPNRLYGCLECRRVILWIEPTDTYMGSFLDIPLKSLILSNSDGGKTLNQGGENAERLYYFIPSKALDF